MSTVIRLLPTIIGFVLGTILFTQGERLSIRTKELATANETIATLREANSHMDNALKTLQREDANLRQLLANQNAAMAKLDNQNRKTADELQQALATPPAGRPDCAREPLPDAALRLLQPAPNRGANAGGKAATATRTGAPLPGA
ncbi:hypothetical protein ACET97_20955 [Aeromonas enteropelogenes]|uniref:hypothetical protein n=1 Tax=Aeromonas enteropelogenes TaxID=29489 RepID=UPI0038CFBE8C